MCNIVLLQRHGQPLGVYPTMFILAGNTDNRGARSQGPKKMSECVFGKNAHYGLPVDHYCTASVRSPFNLNDAAMLYNR